MDSVFRIRQSLAAVGSSQQARLQTEVQQQLAALFDDDFPAGVEPPWLWEYPRYLQALLLRLDKVNQQPDRDRELAAQISRYRDLYQSVDEATRRSDDRLREFRWMIEELRVSLFAQQLKTRVPVSPKRMDKLWDELRH